MTLPDQQARTLLDNLGSFYAELFQDQRQLTSINHARVLELAQTQRKAAAALASLSRFEVPVFEDTAWHALVLRQADRQVVYADQPRYNGDSNYGQTGTSYGPSGERPRYRYPVPASLVNARHATNRLLSPSVIWSVDTDFRLSPDGRFIEFQADPLTDERFPRRSELDEQDEPQLAVTVWLHRTEHDLHRVYNQFGHVLGMYFDRSSEHYRDAVNAVWDTLMFGSTTGAFRRALAALTGTPLVREPSETVMAVLDYPDRLEIATDAHLYTFGPGAAAAVAVGDTVHAGDFLIDAVAVYEGRQLRTVGTKVPALSLDRGLLGAGVRGPLSFQNQALPVSYSTDSQGQAIARFPVGGTPAAVDSFWDQANSFAQLLRTDDGGGQPTANQVPDTVNPMRFILEQYLADHLVLVHLDATALTFPAGMRSLLWLRRLLPPHAALAFSTTATAPTDTFGYNARITEPGGTPVRLPS